MRHQFNIIIEINFVKIAVISYKNNIVCILKLVVFNACVHFQLPLDYTWEVYLNSVPTKTHSYLHIRVCKHAHTPKLIHTHTLTLIHSQTHTYTHIH